MLLPSRRPSLKPDGHFVLSFVTVTRPRGRPALCRPPCIQPRRSSSGQAQHAKCRCTMVCHGHGRATRARTPPVPVRHPRSRATERAPDQQPRRHLDTRHDQGYLHERGWGADDGYPGIVLDDSGPQVEVNVFTSRHLPAHWQRLDDFEGPGYRRVPVTVTSDSGDVAAYVYELADDSAPHSTLAR